MDGEQGPTSHAVGNANEDGTDRRQLASEELGTTLAALQELDVDRELPPVNLRRQLSTEDLLHIQEAAWGPIEQPVLEDELPPVIFKKD